MAVSNVFGLALSSIPFVASAAKNGFTRVRSFTGSFNDRTSLMLAAADGHFPVPENLPTPPPPSQSQEVPAPVTTSATFDIEAATPETVAAAAQAAEAKRVAKMVQTVCLFAASASLVLFVNLPSKPGAAVEADEHAGAGAVLYSVDMTFICLGMFTSLGLSMFSVVAKSGTDDPAVVWVQKRAMVVAVAFVLVSFTLRMCMMLPPSSLESSAWLAFVLLAGSVAVYLALAWKFGAEVASGSAAGAGTANDRV